MPNGNQERVGTSREVFIWRPILWFKDKILNTLFRGKPFREELIPGKDESTSYVYKDIDTKIGINYVAGLNNQLDKIEKDYWPTLMRVRTGLEKLYSEIGPYTDREIILREEDILKYGTGEEDWEMEIRGVPFRFKLPKPTKLIYPDHVPGYECTRFSSRGGTLAYREHELAYFGWDKIREWIPNFRGYLKAFSEELIEKLASEGRPRRFLPGRKKIKEGSNEYRATERNVNALAEDVFFLLLSEQLNSTIFNIESEFYGKLRNVRTKLTSIHSDIGGVKSKFPGTQFEIIYKHTYRVITTEIYDPKTNAIRKFEDEHPGFNVGEEVAPGLDENGWPLEVDNERGTVTNTPNKVLLDHWDGRANRTVEEEWVKDAEPLHVIAWANNEYDSVRDDMRDGRYHGHSLTAIDFAMAANPTPWGEWPSGEWKGKVVPEEKFYDDQTCRDFVRYDMTFDNGSVERDNMRKPSDKSPAFDLRVKRGFPSFRHIGRKYYYDDTHGINADEMRDPLISTRGAAMYIIEKVTRKIKKLGDAELVLRGIGTRVGGYDYGPRKFGSKEWARNPYNLQKQLDEIESAKREEERKGYESQEFAEWTTRI